MYCDQLFTSTQGEWMTCPRAELFIDYRGRVLANHVADKNWDHNEFLSFIRKNGVSWRRIFWKVWGRLHDDECVVCGEKFTFAEIDHCMYHPEPPKFTYGSNIGSFECCGSEAIRFSTTLENKGCLAKSHVPKNLKESSLEWTFIKKHKDLMAELVKPRDNIDIDTEDTKTETAKDNNNEGAASDSNASLLKSQRRKMRLMTLMELHREFISKTGKKN